MKQKTTRVSPTRRKPAPQRPSMRQRFEAKTAHIVCLAIAAIYAACMVVIGNSTYIDAAAKQKPMAMWVWERNVTPNAIAAWAVGNNIKTIYMNTSASPNTEELNYLKSLSTLAKKHRLTLYALNGRASWAEAGNTEAVSWAKKVKALKLFTGIHLDVEPYANSAQWSSESSRNKLVTSYLTMLRSVKKAVGSTRVEADIPFWYDTISVPGSKLNLMKNVMAATNGVTIMAYRDTYAAVNGIIQEELAQAKLLGKPVYVGLETGSTGENQVDFSQEGAASLNSTVAQLNNSLYSHRGFAGVAIHHYDAWRALK